MYEETTQNKGKNHPKRAEEAIPRDPTEPEMFPLTNIMYSTKEVIAPVMGQN